MFLLFIYIQLEIWYCCGDLCSAGCGDAVREGDGEEIISHCKVDLIQFWNQPHQLLTGKFDLACYFVKTFNRYLAYWSLWL